MAEQIAKRIERDTYRNENEYDSVAECLETLRFRFRGRGILHSLNRDAKRQSREAMATRAMAPGAYGAKDVLGDAYRTGECDGVRYMTSGDFVRYYQAHRQKMRPDADLRYMAVVRDRSAVVPTPKQKKPFLAPAGEEDRKTVRKIVSRLPASVRDKHPEIEERAAEVHKWLKADTIREAPAAGKRRFPISVASAILVMTVSLLMVVGGTAMYSDANARYYESLDTLNALKAEEASLERELAVKVDLVEVEDYARNTLGMIDKSYASGEYLSTEQEERIEVYEEEVPAFGLSTLLSAIGIGG